MFGIFKKEKYNLEGEHYKVVKEEEERKELATKELKKRIETNSDRDNLKVIANLLLKILIK